MTDPDVAGPTGRWGEAVERQLERLEARLIAEFCRGPISGRTVREHLAAARENYFGARVWIYLPILIERDVRNQLRNQMPPANEHRTTERQPSHATEDRLDALIASPGISVSRAASIGT
jgi:hypothetical protein